MKHDSMLNHVCMVFCMEFHACMKLQLSCTVANGLINNDEDTVVSFDGF